MNESITQIARRQFLEFLESPVFPSDFYGRIKGKTRDGLTATKNLKIGDYELYATKKITEKKLSMFESSDKYSVGITNLNNSVIPKDKIMVISAISLLYANTANGSDDEVLQADFGSISAKHQIVNGFFTFGFKQKNRIFDSVATSIFLNEPDTRTGMYILGSPVLVMEQIEMEATVEMATMTGIDTGKDFLRLKLHGAWTIPE